MGDSPASSVEPRRVHEICQAQCLANFETWKRQIDSLKAVSERGSRPNTRDKIEPMKGASEKGSRPNTMGIEDHSDMTFESPRNSSLAACSVVEIEDDCLWASERSGHTIQLSKSRSKDRHPS